MQGERRGRVYRLEVTADELHLLVLALGLHCQDCVPERLQRRWRDVEQALARLERGEKAEE